VGVTKQARIVFLRQLADLDEGIQWGGHTPDCLDGPHHHVVWFPLTVQLTGRVNASTQAGFALGGHPDGEKMARLWECPWFVTMTPMPRKAN